MALTQSHYRFGVVELAEATHGWLAGEDRDPALRVPGAAGQFLLRFCVQETAGAAENNVALQFQSRLTPKATGIPGAWANVTTASAVAKAVTTAVFADAANCTKRLGGTGTFEATGAGCTVDGTSGGNNLDIVANGNSETEVALQLVGADTALGDLIEFRLVRTGGTLLTAYPVTPSLRVGVEILAVGSYDSTTHNSLSAGVNKISGTLVAVECSGMSAADLADPTLSMTMNVLGTAVAGSTDPADYTVPLQGPIGWTGGPPSPKTGVSVPPGFSFASDIPEGVKRVLATFRPSRTATFGANATIVEAP